MQLQAKVDGVNYQEVEDQAFEDGVQGITHDYKEMVFSMDVDDADLMPWVKAPTVSKPTGIPTLNHCRSIVHIDDDAWSVTS